jgi:hypothetical protein
MNLKEVSENEFESIDCVRRVIYHDNSRRFAFIEIDNNHGKYGLSWCGDLIEPVIIDEPKSSLIWIGVDQQLVAISRLRGNVILSLQLTSNLVDILNGNSITAVLTESELFIFNFDGSLHQIKTLPEIGSGLSVADDTLFVDLIDGEIVSINLKRF